MDIKQYKEGKKVLYSSRLWYYKNGQKKSKYKSGFEKKKEAEDWCIDEKRRLEGLQVGSDKVKLRDFLERWIKTKSNKLSPTTLSGYNVNIKHINSYLGDTNISKLKLIDIQEMIDSLSNKGLKHKTVKYVYRTLHVALEYAVKNEMIIKNMSEGIEIKDDDEKFEVKVYSAVDLKKLLMLLREQQHPLYPSVLLASMRGLRRGECLGLMWFDVDFKKEISHIKNNYVTANKQKYHKKVKTKESDRTIDISGFVASELKVIKERNIKDGKIQTYVCEIDGKLPDPTHISRELKQFQLANKLPICRFHDLRHTFAVLQLEYGTDLDTLKRLLGHSKIGITSDTYLHKNTTLIKKASVKMDNVINIDEESQNLKISQ